MAPAASPSPSPSPSTSPGTLRVLTWNVRDLLGDPFSLTRVLRAARADVACLQEAPRGPGSRHRLIRVSRDAGMYFVAGGRASAGTAVLASARTRADDVRAVRLPVSGWHARARGAVCAVVSLPGTQRVSLMCVHLGLDAAERADHVGSLLAALPTGVPAVVAGDLNEGPGGPSWLALGARAVDPAQGSSPTFRAARPRHRIDAVLVDPSLEVVAYGFPHGVSEVDVVAASDHRPVLAQIVLPPR